MIKSFRDDLGDLWSRESDGTYSWEGADLTDPREVQLFTHRSLEEVWGISRPVNEGDAINTAPPTRFKPEPGDRVRVTYEAEYMRFSDFFGRPLVTVDDREVRVPADATITVLESTTPEPVVPDEPEAEVVVVQGKSGTYYHQYADTIGFAQYWYSIDTNKASADVGPLDWPELWDHDGPLYRVTRGEEIA